MSLQTKKPRKKTVKFGSLNQRIYRFVQKGFFGRFLTSYDASCESFQNSKLFSRKAKKKNKKHIPIEKPTAEPMPIEAQGIVSYKSETIHRGVRDKFAELFDQSKLIGAAKRIKYALLNTPLVTYGLVLFGFALFLLITQALVLMFGSFNVPLGVFSYVQSNDTVLTVAYMAAAVVLMALSLMLIFAQEGSLSTFMINSVLIGALLRATTGITQFHKGVESKRTIRRKYAFLIGAFLGILSFLATPYRFFIGFLILLLVAIIVNVPEFGLIVGIFSLPYLSLFKHPTLIAVCFSAVLIFSTLLKLIRGKRTHQKEPLDLLVGIFLLAIVGGGIVTVGGTASRLTALTMALLGSLYFVVIILVRDAGWIKRCLNAFMFSSIPVAILAILEFALGKANTVWQDLKLFPTLAGRAASLWGNPNVLAEFLLVTFFVSLGSLMMKQSLRSKLFCLVTLALNAAALVFTWSRGAWLALAITLIVFFLTYSHKALPFVILAAIAFAAAFVFLPETFVSRIESIVTFSDSSTLYRIHIWQGCASLIRDVFWSGVGVGSEAFSNAYLPYALPGIEAAPHAHNLLMQIVIELGVVGAIVFLALTVTLCRVAYTTFAKCRIKHPISLQTLGVLMALLALLFHGLTEYIWYNYRIFMLFFLLIGLVRAARRVGEWTIVRQTGDADSCDVEITLTR